MSHHCLLIRQELADGVCYFQRDCSPPVRVCQRDKYLVQEFLVDKFFARLEQLNNTDKVNQEKEKPQESPSEIDTEIDEFADLEALLDGTPLNENNNTEDLSDRNS